MDARVKVSDPDTWPEHIRARYGVRPRPWWRVPLLVTLGVGLLAAVTLVGVRLSQPAISAGLSTYEIADDHVRISFETQRREATPATCVLRARSEDGFDVGYAVVELPAGSGRALHTYQLRTAYRALVAELLGCGTAGVPPGIPAAQFRPGVLPPAQPWSPSQG